MKKNLSNLVFGLTVCFALLIVSAGCKKNDKTPIPPTLNITTAASGLAGPMGVDVDGQGNLWVSESGTDEDDGHGNTHNDNGKVVIVTPDGKKYDAIVNLSSYANVHSKELQGTVHILLDKNILYVLSGDYLYPVDISGFKAGDPAIDAGTLQKEDIVSVISAIPSPSNPDKDSHPYNLTIGPDGDLYIADAGANAILHRKGANDYVILAELPLMQNPTPDMGGPVVQPVPTSVRYDGKDFLVTTLTGFPFNAKQAVIYRVSLTGDVSVYQDGFTMLVDQAAGNGSTHLVVQYASAFGLPAGFTPDSGALLWVNGTTVEQLADGLNQPVGIKQVDDHTWYVTSLGDGTVLKVTYQ